MELVRQAGAPVLAEEQAKDVVEVEDAWVDLAQEAVVTVCVQTAVQQCPINRDSLALR